MKKKTFYVISCTLLILHHMFMKKANLDVPKVSIGSIVICVSDILVIIIVNFSIFIFILCLLTKAPCELIHCHMLDGV